jgi:multiple sugar transport system permease protein
MRSAGHKFEEVNRSLLERLFEPPAVDKMSPVAKLFAYVILAFWSIFVLFPIYWVVITSFKDAKIVNEGPFYIPFVDFTPSLDGWTFTFAAPTDPFCDFASFGRHIWLLVHNAFAFLASPIAAIQPMEAQICKIGLAFTNSVVVSFGSTVLCIVFGSMAAYALARIQYRPKFGSIITFVVFTLITIAVTSYMNLHWAAVGSVALALFFLFVRAVGKHFTSTLGNGDILFWIISQRILPPVVVIIPVYMMFQEVGMIDSQMALILVYAVANLPIVVWLMHDFFASLPIELEESAQIDGATKFGIFWDIVLPLTRPGLAATTLLTLILSWNEYLFAVFLTTAKAQTMPIMIASKNSGERGILWWEMCAIIVVMIVPVIIMAIILQRYIAKGVLLGAVKG